MTAEPDKSFIVAIDQGTTSSRALVFDRKGKVIASSQAEFEQHFPKAGWVEHDPMEIWASQSSVIAKALAKGSIAPRQIAAIGITNQRETTVVWDRHTGEPVYNAIVWQDRRTAGYIDQLKQDGHAEMVAKKTGLVLDAYFSATKVRWILDHVPGARERADRGDLAFGTIDSWLVWKLTSGKLHITEVSNASRTMLFNIYERRWDEALLKLFGIPASMLPEVRSSSEVYGTTSPEVYPVPVPIAGMAGDQQAALFGQLCHSPGMAKTTYGTGCFVMMHTGEVPVQSANRLLTTIAWEREGKVHYALEGSVFIGGAAVQWLRDSIKLIGRAEETEKLAMSLPDNDGVYFVPAMAGLGAPHWDPHARGAFFGITRGTTIAHMARATLEAIAYQVLDVLRAMEKDRGGPVTEMRVDGGAARNNFLMQFQADVMQRTVRRPKNVETTAVGAAFLAGLAVGFWKDVDELQALWAVDATFDPALSEEEVEAYLHFWQKAVERSKNWTI